MGRLKKSGAAVFGSMIIVALLAQPVSVAHAGVVLTGITTGNNNEDVPVNYGSNSAGAPAIALTWSGTGDSSPEWEIWGHGVGWDNEIGNYVFQADSGSGTPASNDQLSITFAPTNKDVILTSFVLDHWTNSGADPMLVDWSVTGSSSGLLGSSTASVADGARETVNVNLRGTGAETLTLTLHQQNGDGTYLALDDLTYAQTPEPSSLGLLGLAGLSAFARRRKQRAAATRKDQESRSQQTV